MSFSIKFLIAFLYCFSFIFFVNGQGKQSDHDSTFFITYPNLITTRFYFSQKYTNFTLGANKGTPDLIYRPNTTLNMGVGATYRNLTLNLAYGFGFLNNNYDKGKTKYLDLQSHLYSRTLAIDLSAQFYKGYYLNNKQIRYPGSVAFYVRPDVGITLLGGSVYRVLNSRNFSFGAATLLNEWQIKSAGSFLIGAEIFYGSIGGDSAFVPTAVAVKYDQAGIRKIHMVKLGPGAGYAYTYVYNKHFFLTGAFTANINAGLVREFNGADKSNRITFSPNYIYRFALGYNSAAWACNFMLVGNEVNFRGAASPNNNFVRSGNFRINLIKRLMPGPALKEKLRLLDNIFLSKK
jgi:hypothetical protein